MREIKFRAWDEHRKTMGDVCFMNDVDADTWEVDYICNPGEPKTGLVLEQFTGLHDKNGREIYEGDIVKSVALMNDHHQMGATDTFTVRYFASSFCYCWKHQESGVPIFPFCVSHDIEVIGNIHENSELLTQR